MTYILFALLSALSASLVAITIKIGIKNVSSSLLTLIRTFLILIFSFVMVLITNGLNSFKSFDITNWIYLVLSGISTGLSWIFYNNAIKHGDVNKVAPIDKSSFILTSILFFIFFFDATTKNGDILTIILLILSILLMGVGTLLMINREEKDSSNKNANNTWLISAILSAVFASLTSLFIKLGLKDVPTMSATFIRTGVVLIFSFLIVIFKKEIKGINKIDIKTWIFILLSSILTFVSWFSEYEAYNTVNSSPLVVSSITKLSILFTMLFSFLILKEKFKIKSIIGLSLITVSIILIIVFSL